MDEKQTHSSLRRYNLINNDPADGQQRNHQQIIPISIDHLSTPATISYKRRRCSITNEASLSTQLSSNNQDFTYDRNVTMTNSIGSRKRSAQDDSVTYTAHHFLRDHEQYTHKRARYDHPKTIESENQPPLHSSIKRRSLVFQHQQEQDLLSSTWDNLRASNEVPLLFNTILPSLPRLTTTTTTPYHRTNSAPNHDHNLSDHYSPLITEHHHSSLFHSNSLLTSNAKSTIPKTSKSNLRLLSPQSNGSSPLCTTKFILDTKQQTILRTGNISPAHSDSSSESTSTCSSDEQSHHHHHYHFHQPQPWRSYRERENYEQLLDLAEKLSDPNRVNQVDIHQFFSYRYKTSTLSSKQTACVICMSHFKNGQHIRVLPCQHEYHSKCIARWFTMNSSCPICRRDNFLSSC